MRDYNWCNIQFKYFIKYYLYFFSFLIFIIIFFINAEKVIEKVVLSINDKSYTLTELKNFQNNFNLFIKKNNLSPIPLTLEQSFDQFVDQKVLIQIFSEYNFQINDSEYQFALQNYKNQIIKEAFQIGVEINSLKDLNTYLKTKNYPKLDFLSEQLKQTMMTNKLIQHFIMASLIDNPKEEELKKAYELNKNKLYKEAEVKLGHIILYVYPEDEKNYILLKKKEELAESILKKLKNNTDTFESLAKKYSQDSKTKYKGGIIGWMSEENLVNISHEYAQVFNYDINAISPLIWTKKGIHIIKVFDKKKEREFTFLESKTFLKNQLLINLAKEKLSKILETRKNILYNIKKYPYE